jgi:hypothetical protein
MYTIFKVYANKILQPPPCLGHPRPRAEIRKKPPLLRVQTLWITRIKRVMTIKRKTSLHGLRVGPKQSEGRSVQSIISKNHFYPLSIIFSLTY